MTHPELIPNPAEELGFRRAVQMLDAYSGATALFPSEDSLVAQTVKTVNILNAVLSDPDPDASGHAILGLLSLSHRLLSDLEEVTGHSRLELFIDLIDDDFVRCLQG
jgi:hypothetical protein